MPPTRSALEAFERDGFLVAPELIDEAHRDAALGAFRSVHGRAGGRSALDHPAIEALAASRQVQDLARALIGADALCERALLFHKVDASNWRVQWHQDTVVRVSRRFEAPGWTSWSEKEGQVCVRPPRELLERRLALRIDLDGSDDENGGLRVAPGSHRAGIAPAEQVAARRAAHGEVTPPVPARGALAMRPLLFHASSRSRSERPRRVVHLEFAPAADAR